MVNRFLSEHLVNSRDTNILLYNLNEEQELNISDKVVAQLYKTMCEKYEFIDFGNIPGSRGNINKLNELETIEKTLQLLDDLRVRSNIQPIEELEIIKTSITLLKNNSLGISKLYLQDNNLMVMLYNSTVYGIIAGTSLLVSTMVTYIKGVDSFEIVMNKMKSNKDYLVFSSLKNFNQYVIKGELSKFIGLVDGKNFVGTVAITIGCVTVLLPVLRSIIFSFYDVRMSVSEYLNQQSEFIKLNAEVLSDNGTKTRLDKKKVVKNQIAFAKKLETISDKISVKFNSADKKGKAELSKKIDPKDTLPSFDGMLI